MKLARLPQLCQRLHHQLSCSLLLAPSILLIAVPAHAGTLSSWRFNPQQNQLELTTDEGVQPRAQLVTDPTRLVIDLPGVMLGRAAIKETYEGAIQSLRIGQFDRETTRVVIELAPGYTLDPQQVKFRGISAQQWIVTLPPPKALTATGQKSDHPALPVAPSPVVVQTQTPLNSTNTTPQLAVIEAIELDSSNQLIIRANQPIRYSSRWERSTGEFRIEIPTAQFADHIKGPQLEVGSPLQRIRLRRETADSVAIFVRPASGVQLGPVNPVNARVLALVVQRSQMASPQSNPSTASTVQTPFPNWTPSQPSQRPIPNGRAIVIIDPGHGGPDPGAVGVGGLQEKGIVLDIGRQVAGLLQQRGIQALLTRSDDRDLDLEPRVQMAEQADATVFVSIHANSIDLSRPDINGLETYYFQSGSDLAQAIHQTILQSVRLPDRGVRTARFYVLRKTSMPSVLVEVGFVTGRDDAMKLANPSYRAQMADAIARGILQYLQRTAKL